MNRLKIKLVHFFNLLFVSGYREKLESDRESVAYQNLMSQNNTYAYNKMYSSPDLLSHYLVESTHHFHKTLAQKIISFLPKDFSNLSFLDVGCGTGHLLARLRELGCQGNMAGTDTAQAAAEPVNAHNVGIKFYCGTLDEVVLDDVFDVIICSEVLEHCTDPEIVIQSMMNKVAVGGRIFITVPDGRKDTWEGHIHFWSPESFKIFIDKIHSKVAYEYFDNVNLAVLYF